MATDGGRFMRRFPGPHNPGASPSPLGLSSLALFSFQTFAFGILTVSFTQNRATAPPTFAGLCLFCFDSTRRCETDLQSQLPNQLPGVPMIPYCNS